MDMYGLPAPDFFHIDDLLDLPNDDIFSSSTPLPESNVNHYQHHLLQPEIPAGNRASSTSVNCDDSNRSNNFTDDLCVPGDDIAELEWLSKFVDDSFTDFPVNEIADTTNFRLEASVPGRARSKRTRAASTHRSWTSLPEYDNLVTGKYKLISSMNSSSSTARKRENSSAASTLMVGEQSSPSSSTSSSSPSSGGVRKCTHCASEKTPQWRTGPLGPKTLCNACGVRYKSGRLVPEYRPAASPTFVLTQHSNSHRKVMELRRQKEVHRQQDNGGGHHHHQQLLLYQHHHHDFKVC